MKNENSVFEPNKTKIRPTMKTKTLRWKRKIKKKNKKSWEKSIFDKKKQALHLRLYRSDRNNSPIQNKWLFLIHLCCDQVKSGRLWVVLDNNKKKNNSDYFECDIFFGLFDLVTTRNMCWTISNNSVEILSSKWMKQKISLKSITR